MFTAARLALLLTRPRFWPYVLGPFAVAVLAGAQSTMPWVLIILWGLFWTYPANYIIYGANDVFDYETDKRNPKKNSYELLIKPSEKKAILGQVIAWSIVGLILAVASSSLGVIAAYLLFLFFGIGYSAPPVRAKARPVLDSIFNILYVFPGVLGYILVAGELPSLRLVVAATAWCMAMHAFSAIPDITADTKAGIRTIATLFGARLTIVFCAACYTLAAVLTQATLGVFSIFGAAVYLFLMVIAYAYADRPRELFRTYTWFPYVNIVMGAALFWWIVLIVA